MGNKVKGVVGRHPVLAGMGMLIVVSAVVGGIVWNSMFGLEPTVVYFGVPDAPTLTATNNETIYRLDASRSTITYTVTEKLAGTTHTATGTTRGIAGDIALNTTKPADSRIGDIVINVQQLTSDQQLRDERLRHDYLQSNDYQTATFSPTTLDGLPTKISEDTPYKFTITGDLTVKETTKPATLKATGTLTGNELHLNATTTISLTNYGIGPINMVGFAQADDNARLDFNLTAIDTADFTDTNRVASAATTNTKPTGTSPSFTNAVQPILENSCASCHQTGEAGAPFWELTDASDATRIADGLALITKSRYMPPFLATDAGIPLKHDPRLTNKQITTIEDWANAGAPLDTPTTTPIKAPDDAVLHPRADMTLTAAAPYEGSTNKTNDYRCLIMDPELDTPAVATGYEFVPDKNEFVHHALTYRMTADQREGVDQRDADDPGTGYECFGGVGAGPGGLSPSGRGRGSELVAGWAPGAKPGIYPDGAGLKMQPGDFFVTQVHYHYVHAAPPDQSQLILQLGSEPTENYADVAVSQYLAPAEIPCMPDEKGPLCDRAASIQALTDEFGPAAPVIANGLNAVCGSTPEETANVDAEGISTSSCEHGVSSVGKLLSVNGHMHELGRTFRMTLNPDTPGEKVLLDIDRWDFNWQFSYVPVEDIVLTSDDTIKVECSWDRNLINPQAEPRWISWSEGTEDEMCFSTVATIEPRE
jgi:polyisoprenoid-binding protein YceI